MNALAANDLKRHGISAVEHLLANGPVHIIKRNQPVCVVLAASAMSVKGPVTLLTGDRYFSKVPGLHVRLVP